MIDKRVLAAEVAEGTHVWLYDPESYRTCEGLAGARIPTESPDPTLLELHHMPRKPHQASALVVLCRPGDWKDVDNWERGQTFRAHTLLVWTSYEAAVSYHVARLMQTARRIQAAAQAMLAGVKA